MRKTLLLLPALLTTMLVGCGKYASLAQAEDACDEWIVKGEKITYLVKDRDSSANYPRYDERFERDRFCRLEEETNQYLGYQGEFSKSDREKEGEKVHLSNKPEAYPFKVVKNFYY